MLEADSTAFMDYMEKNDLGYIVDYFVIISAQDSAYRFLSSLFFSLTFPQLGLDQMTNPNVRKAVLAMRKEVQKIPAFAIQSTHGKPPAREWTIPS